MKNRGLKRLILLCSAVTAFGAASGARVERMLVRQNWPWTTDVKVDYVLADVTSPVDMQVRVSRGGTELTVPHGAVSGQIYGLSKDGAYSLTIDAAQLSGGTGSDIAVTLEMTDSPWNTDEEMYRIVDLSNGAVKTLTCGDILSGEYGTYETSFDFVGTTSLSPVLIWTGVTNDVKYMTTHLVLRKIPVAGVKHEIGTADKRHPVILSKDFWLGVFEVTQAQFQLMTGEASGSAFRNPDCAATRPAENFSYGALRGTTLGVNWVEGSDFATAHKVDATSRIAAIRNRLKDDRYDLPSDAQWEVACRAGTLTTHYTGSDLPSGTSATSAPEMLKPLARYKYNGGYCIGRDTTAPEPDVATVDTTRGTARVGSYLPNAYGLYDVLGNVRELCLDWDSDWPTREGVIEDPMGGPAAQRRQTCGAGWSSNGSDCRLQSRGVQHPSGSENFSGFRLCLTEE